MKATVSYSIDDTTDRLELEGHRITGQLFADKRGMIQVFDADNKRTRFVILANVYYIDVRD